MIKSVTKGRARRISRFRSERQSRLLQVVEMRGRHVVLLRGFGGAVQRWWPLMDAILVAELGFERDTVTYSGGGAKTLRRMHETAVRLS